MSIWREKKLHEKQAISKLNKANYQKKNWEKGMYIYFDVEFFKNCLLIIKQIKLFLVYSNQLPEKRLKRKKQLTILPLKFHLSKCKILMKQLRCLKTNVNHYHTFAVKDVK